MTSTETPDPNVETGTRTEPAAGLTPEQLARLRDTLVAAYPDTVAELVTGADFETLVASVEPARQAYQRVRDETARAALADVPRGGATSSVDAALLASLEPEAKIAAALRGR